MKVARIFPPSRGVTITGCPAFSIRNLKGDRDPLAYGQPHGIHHAVRAAVRPLLFCALAIFAHHLNRGGSATDGLGTDFRDVEEDRGQHCEADGREKSFLLS